MPSTKMVVVPKRHHKKHKRHEWPRRKVEILSATVQTSQPRRFLTAFRELCYKYSKENWYDQDGEYKLTARVNGKFA